jgi:7-carboxy-7-deazaguanine synthase
MKQQAALGFTASNTEVLILQMSVSHLVYAEDFYSIQGEGAAAGTPAVFLRLAGCNLQCPGFSYKDPMTGEHLGCDSKAVWRRGERVQFAQLLQRWRDAGWLQALEQGAHLVITGGEPLVQQQRVLAFIDYLDATLQQDVFIEIETNGTLLFEVKLLHRLNQINVSPKLTNSGEARAKALVSAVMQQLAVEVKAKFKFVVDSELDVQEIIKNYVTPFAIPAQRVWLMPEGGTQQELQLKREWVVEQCKQYLFNYSPRLQVIIWDEVTGV